LLIPGTIPLFILGIIIIAPAASRNVRNLLRDRDSVTKWFTAPLEEKVLFASPQTQGERIKIRQRRDQRRIVRYIAD
jgi:hypothetical protein